MQFSGVYVQLYFDGPGLTNSIARMPQSAALVGVGRACAGQIAFMNCAFGLYIPTVLHSKRVDFSPELHAD